MTDQSKLWSLTQYVGSVHRFDNKRPESLARDKSPQAMRHLLLTEEGTCRIFEGLNRKRSGWAGYSSGRKKSTGRCASRSRSR